ncbi:MAG TPA: GDSL-type esterase/lipase family protein, partial [Polyangiaceae bacterium]
PALAALTLLAFAGALELSPRLARFRLLGARPAPAAEPRVAAPAASASVGEATLETETVDRGAPAAAAPKKRGPIAAADEVDPALPGKDQPPRPLDDPSGRALDRFYAKLARVEAKQAGAVARIAHFGDSTVVSDFVSGTLRRDLQRRFGDAGHGFVLIANAWPSYFHFDVTRYATAGFKVSRIVGPYADDGFYGLGGVSFRAGPHSLARFGTAANGDFGRSVSRFVIAYAEETRGGRFQVRLDGKDLQIIDTKGPALAARYHEVRAPDGPHELELQTLSGESRLFGVILERDQPGVVLDALGIQGARVRFLDKQDDAHFAEQLRARGPDLVVYQFGANESGDGFVYSMADFHRTMKEVVQQQQRALPESSCLVIGAMDRAAKQGEEIVSVRVIPSLVEEQRLVSEEVGCAFFDTYRAMGGRGSMPIWVRRGLAQADLTHPSGVGAERIGHWVFGAVMRGFSAWQKRETKND